MSTFLCPMFNVQTNSAACQKLLDLKMKGQSPDVRRGCQACMDSSKCPFLMTVTINQNARRNGYELTLDNGVPKAVLERIRPVKLHEASFGRRNVPMHEREVLYGANERIDKMLGRAPSGQKAVSKRRIYTDEPKSAATTTKPVVSKSAPTINSTDLAAATGDLGAAISHAA